jgi:hypothetical protein
MATGSPEAREPDQYPSGPDPGHTEPRRSHPEHRADRGDREPAGGRRHAAKRPTQLARGADATAALQRLTGAKEFLLGCAAPELTAEAAAHGHQPL